MVKIIIIYQKVVDLNLGTNIIFFHINDNMSKIVKSLNFGIITYSQFIIV